MRAIRSKILNAKARVLKVRVLKAQNYTVNSKVKYLTFASTFSSLFAGRFLATFSSFSFQELTNRLSNAHHAHSTLKNKLTDVIAYF